MRHTWARGLAMALAVGVGMSALVACDDDSDDRSGRDGADRGEPTSLSAGFSVRGALAELPAGTSGLELDQAMISVADLDAATTAVGATRPTDAGREAWVEWMGPLTGIGPSKVFLALPQGFNTQAAAPEEFAEVAGWSAVDVRSYAELSAPPYTFTVVQGVPDNALADSLVDSGDGIRSTREGEDFEQDLEEVSSVDRLGRPIRFLQRDDRVGFGTSTALVTAWAEDGASLADDDSFDAVAAALDEEEVISAVLARAPRGGLAATLGQRLSPEQLRAVQEELDGMLPEKPFDTVGIGWSADGEVHVVYHFADDGAARASVDSLERAWREGTTVQGRQPMSDLVTVDEVEAEGEVVVVTVEPADGRAGVPLQMLQSREFVFVAP